MFALIFVVAVIYFIGTNFGDHAAAIAVLIAMGLFIVLFIKAGHDNNKAYNNWVNYWKNKE